MSGDSLSASQFAGSMPSTKRFGSKPGFETKREHLAGRRIERDQRAAPLAERGLRRLLQLDVERQLADCCRRSAACAKACAPRGRRHRPRPPRRRSCRAARARSDSSTPDLADVVGALVVRGLAPVLDALDVAVVDAADVADDVRGDLAERVLAEQPRLDLHARKAVTVDREARDLLVGQPRAQRQAFEVLRFLEERAGTACGRAAGSSTTVASSSMVASRFFTREGVTSSVYAE